MCTGLKTFWYRNIFIGLQIHIINMTSTPHACRFYDGGNGTMTLYIKKDLTDEIKECFLPMRDFSAIFNPESETLTIFKPRAP